MLLGGAWLLMGEASIVAGGALVVGLGAAAPETFGISLAGEPVGFLLIAAGTVLGAEGAYLLGNGFSRAGACRCVVF